MTGVQTCALPIYEAEATRRFEEWMKQNEAKNEAKKSGLEKSKDDETVNRLAAEKKINDARIARLAKRQADLAAKAERESKPVAPAAEEAPAAETQAEPQTEGDTATGQAAE